MQNRDECSPEERLGDEVLTHCHAAQSRSAVRCCFSSCPAVPLTSQSNVKSCTDLRRNHSDAPHWHYSHPNTRKQSHTHHLFTPGRSPRRSP